VTYNSGSPPQGNEIDEHLSARTGLALRILWSCLCRNQIDWSDFVDKVGVVTVAPVDALKFISRRYDKPVLLCVDELMKSTNPKEVVSAIGSCLDQIENFDAVVSTLDIYPVTQEETDSKRKICWVKMTPLKLEHGLELFRSILSQAPGREVVIEACISDCNGHGRSLETLALHLRNPACREIDSYSAIMDAIADQVKGSLQEVSIEMVTLALAGNTVSLSDDVITFDKRKKSISQCISAGYYLNSLVGGEKNVIPQLSPLLLRAFARAEIGNDALRSFCQCILNMLNLETNFHAKLYEKFHANWEVLIRFIRPLNKQMSLLEFYGIKDTDTPDPTPVLRFSPKEKIVEVLKRNLTTAEIGNRYVCLPAFVNTPGYDIVLGEQQADGSPFNMAFQCKWSHENATTSLSKTELMAAWANTRSELAAIPEEQLFLVAVVWRDTTRELSTLHTQEVNDSDPPKKHRILVLNKERLQRLYSPTLIQRPEFLMKLPQTEK
jgi:hypothetical protein